MKDNLDAITKAELKAKKKKYHKKYYQKNRKRLLERQKNYEKLRRKKLEQIKPILNEMCKGLVPRNGKGFKGFQRKYGKFSVVFD